MRTDEPFKKQWDAKLALRKKSVPKPAQCNNGDALSPSSVIDARVSEDNPPS